jgi:hypothetical protein
MTVSLDRFVTVDITRATRTVSRRGFGTVMLAGYHTAWADRVRSYSDPDDMVSDGLPDFHPLVLAARSLVAQDPRVPTFKIGRRVGAPIQTMRLFPSTPTEAEEYEVTINGVRFPVVADAVPTIAEITAAFTLLMNADTDAVIASGVTSTTGIQTLSGATFNGLRGDGPYEPPRNVTFTLNAHADWDATIMTVAGLDTSGRVQTETFNIPDGGGTTLTGAKIFSEITTLTIPAQSGAGGTLLMGVGVLFDLAGDLDFTATDGATYVQVAMDDTGAWFAFTDVSLNLDMRDMTALPATSLQTDLADIQAVDADWYGLVIVDAQSGAQISDANTWVANEVVLHAAHSVDFDVPTTATDDIASSLENFSALRTFLFWSRANHGSFPNAALLGRIFPLTVGSATYAFKQLIGISPDSLGETEVEILIGTPQSPGGKRVTAYIEAVPTGTNTGTAITVGGQVPGGEWIDVIVGIDFIRARLQEVVINLLISSPKVPFTEAGIDSIVGLVRNVLNLVARAPYAILDPASITVQGTALADVPEAERQARYYDGVNWDARVQGAIHATRIRGTVRP